MVDALWEDDPPETAQKALQVYVSRLRKLLGSDRVETRTPGYLLRVEPDELDLDRFGRLHAEGELDEALALWRGPPLAEFARERFAQPEIGRLEELRLACLEERGERELARGAHAELVSELELLVKEHPLREPLWAQLMLCLYRAGRQADALAAYHAARGALVDELGIEPGRRLRALQQAILEQDPALDPPATRRPRGTTFVGRAAELSELVAGLDDAFAGHGRLFLLEGEPGIGKSRLAEELIAAAETRGAQVLVGRCWEAGGAPAYWPWVQSLRAYVRARDTAALRFQLGAGAAQLAQIVPELREHFPDLPGPASLESEGARFRLFDAAAAFLRNASERRPILLVLDDLHAADAPSLLLLRFLARELASSRICVLAAYRDVDPVPRPELTALIAELAREPLARRMALRGLSEPELAELVELTASTVASAELVAALHRDVEGNPLFAGEIVRLFAVEGTRTDPAGGLRLAIPETVRDFIARRLGHLSEECNRLLVLASVMGREFTLDMLARLGGVSEDQVLDELEEAMAARVVADVPGMHGALRFAHVLIRDTLYERLTATRRMRLHRLAVGALEGSFGERSGPHLAELAHHAMAGSEFEAGLRYARQAGDRSAELLAYEEAARLYGTALEALELASPGDVSARCGVLLSLGEAQIRAGQSVVAKQTFFAAADVARRRGLPHELARAAAGYAGRTTWVRAGGDDRLVPLLEEGLGAVGDDVELRATLLGRLAGALRDDPSRERADALSREAVELARGTENPAALAHALDGRAYAILAPDTMAEIFALGSELRDVAARSGDGERMIGGHMLRVMAQVQQGNIRGAEADVDAATRIAEQLRQPDRLWEVWTARAMLALAAGRLGEAEALAERAFTHGQRALPVAAIPVERLQRYTRCELRGGLDALAPAIQALVAEHPSRPVFRCVLAHLYARIGRTADAQALLGDLGQDDFSAIPFEQEWLYGMCVLAETAAMLADTDRAAALYRRLVPFAACNAMDLPEGMRGSVSRYLGLLAWAISRLDDAARHFEDALEMNERMGAQPWLAYTRADYARMLEACGGDGDRQRARALSAAALAAYRELGMTAGERLPAAG
jgi:DNA-binding SARP family transcriptional activator